jgi:hypothetical protein
MQYVPLGSLDYLDVYGHSSQGGQDKLERHCGASHGFANKLNMETQL